MALKKIDTIKSKYYWLIFLLTIGLVITSGCNTSNDTIENRILAIIGNDCNEPCTIDIREITNFKWDKMYVFKHTASPRYVTKIIQTPPKHNSEFTRKIIFTLNSNIVYEEEKNINIEEIEKYELLFDIPDTAYYKMYQYNNARFTILTNQLGTKTYYKLIEIK